MEGSAPYPSRWRRRISRGRTGCLPCRQRKKKCDEQQPRCLACTRMNLECTWPPPPPSSTVSESSSAVSLAIDSDSDGSTIAWSEPLRSFTGIVKAVFLTPHSHLLLQHYLVQLGPSMAPIPLSQNPFVSVVMPLAYGDDLVMQCVMALGGANLTFKQPAKVDIQASMTAHYYCVVANLRKAFYDFSSRDTSKVLRILLVIILVANFETFAGNCLNGQIFPHLRAGRQLILWLIDNEKNHPLADNDDKFLLGFLLESYSYMVLVNNFCPSGALDRAVPYDAFLSNLSTLAVYPSFGFMFDGTHGLMEIIPEISKLAVWRLDKEEETVHLATLRQTLHTRITQWERPTMSDTDQNDNTVTLERVAIAECYRHALYLYLETSAAGPVAWNTGDAGMSRVQAHIQAIAGMVAAAGLQESRYTAIIMWPLLIAGSCLIHDDLRVMLSTVMRESPSSTWNAARASQVLEMLWDERVYDEKVFGSYGLYLTMKRRGINFCMA